VHLLPHEAPCTDGLHLHQPLSRYVKVNLILVESYSSHNRGKAFGLTCLIKSVLMSMLPYITQLENVIEIHSFSFVVITAFFSVVFLVWFSKETFKQKLN
jgi:hypothetical protein